MKLASLKHGGRDGTLIVVNRTLSHYCLVSNIAHTLQYALENWAILEAPLQQTYAELNRDHRNALALRIDELSSPLPRAYQWLDGSAYLSHVQRVRRARGAQMPTSFFSDPLMYQGGSDAFLAPHDPIAVADESWGIDFEAEVAVITGDVPQAITAAQAGITIRLVLLVNDVSLRNLIPTELAKGFGFLHGKPPSAFSPVAVTPDELAGAWLEHKVHLPIRSTLNGVRFGAPNAGQDMQFDFSQLIAHAAKTRRLPAGTIIGSGTVSNNDLDTGCSCIVEKRVLEIVELGQPCTPFLHYGDRIHIDLCDNEGRTICGAIEQTVAPWQN